MISSMNWASLSEGVTMLTRGQGCPSGIASGNWGPSSVHGHPVLPAGAGGSSFRVGRRISRMFRRDPGFSRLAPMALTTPGIEAPP
jgi:hypothetical protein